MTKALASLTLLLFPLSALAFEQTEKPHITIGKEPENSSGCTLYQILYPKHYHEAAPTSVSLITHAPELKFYMEIMPHGNPKLLSSVVCANDEWFEEASLRLVYKPPKSKNKDRKSCSHSIEYDNLSKYIKR